MMDDDQCDIREGGLDFKDLAIDQVLDYLDRCDGPNCPLVCLHGTSIMKRDSNPSLESQDRLKKIVWLIYLLP